MHIWVYGSYHVASTSSKKIDPEFYVMVDMCAKFQLLILRLHSEPWESVFRSAGFRAQPAVIAAQLPLSIAVHFDTPLCHHKRMCESGYGKF